MALQTEREELLAAWRALSSLPGVEGWNTIRIAHGGPCPLLAGRRFPGNEEALIVGFDTARVPPADQLPQGWGFVVARTDLGGREPGRTWIALCRQSQGRLDLFALMAVDVIMTLETLRNADGERLVREFIARIRAWQEFMRRGDDGVLSAEAEVGLFGEVEMLLAICEAGLPPVCAVQAWQGPMDGLQDFSLGAGAIEVKSTLSASGFPAKVGSFDQLDDSVIRPIFLAGIRLALASTGQTLPARLAAARDALRVDSLALATFDSRLIHAGFIHEAAPRYTRRFLLVKIRLLSVSGDFPRFTRGNVPPGIRAARYELDLDLIQGLDTALGTALEQLGVI